MLRGIAILREARAADATSSDIFVRLIELDSICQNESAILELESTQNVGYVLAGAA
jgi:hypothetical protein